MNTDSSLTRIVVKNATSNLFRLAGAGIVALLLPPFLVRMLPTETYGTWVLLLQLTMYVNYLDFGISTAVARFVAHAEELNDFEQRDGIVSTAFVMLVLAATLGLVLMVLLAWQMPHIFRQMPLALWRPAQVGFVLMGGSFALGLPLSVISAVFIGMQRNEIPAALAIANKFAMALFVVSVVSKQYGIAVMGAAVALANLLSYGGAIVVWRIWAKRIRIRIAFASRLWARQIGGYSATLLIWMAGMLLVAGLDLIVVGVFDYKATAYYGLAATLTNFVTQAQGAIFAALLPASAVLGARGDGERLAAMLVASTRYGMLILLAMAIPLIVGGHWILRFWAGAEYAQHSTVILQVLVIANVIRLCALPYATLLLGTGQQGRVIASPLAEGITNLIASVVGAYWFGAIGVAIGTLIGAFVSVGMHLFYNMPRTVVFSIDRAKLVKEGLLRPILCGLPFLLLLPFRPAPDVGGHLSLFAIATLGAALLFWKYGLIGSERARVVHALRWI